MPTLKPTPSGYYLWNYVPSRVAAIIVAILFLCGTATIIWRSLRTKTMFAIPFVIGGLFQVGGYAARIAAYDATNALAPYIAQYILILVAPALFAASIYMVLGRVIRSTGGERHCLINPTRLTHIFVGGDVVSFWTQVAGGSLQSMKKLDPNISKYIVLVGLGFQIVMFSIFCVITINWHHRMNKRPTKTSSLPPQDQWRSVIYMLYSVSVMIMVRSLFRVIEYAMGYLLSHEWPTYAFDSALMVITVFVFGWWYPGLFVLPKESNNSEEVKSLPIDRTYNEERA